MSASLVRRNLVISLAFGFLMGCIFPLFSSLFVSFKSVPLLIVYAAGCIAAGLIVGFCSFLISQATYGRTIRKLNRQIHSIRSNKLDNFTPLHIDSADCVGELVEGFNAVVKDLRELYTDISEKTLRTSSESILIRDFFEENRKSLLFMKESSVHIQQESGRQTELLETTERSYKALKEKILLNIANIVELYSAVEALRTVLEDESVKVAGMLANAGVVLSEIDSIRGVISDLSRANASTLDTLSRLVRDLGERIGDINEIAEKTNILSINASIESARLGNKGTGFRIIALNIRKLSESVTRFVRTMEGLLDQGRGEIAALMTGSGTLFQVHDTRFAGITRDLEDLITTQKEIETVNHEMSASRSELQESLREMRENMNVLKTSTEETRRSLDDLSKSILSAAERLSDVEFVIKNDTVRQNDMADQVDKFFRQIIGLEKAAVTVHEKNR